MFQSLRILRLRIVSRTFLGAVRVLAFGLNKHSATWPPQAMRSPEYYYGKATGHIAKQVSDTPDGDGLDHDYCVIANIILARMARLRGPSRGRR